MQFGQPGELVLEGGSWTSPYSLSGTAAVVASVAGSPTVVAPGPQYYRLVVGGQNATPFAFYFYSVDSFAPLFVPTRGSRLSL